MYQGCIQMTQITNNETTPKDWFERHDAGREWKIKKSDPTAKIEAEPQSKADRSIVSHGHGVS